LKNCSRCKRTLALSKFNKDKSRTDGYAYWCKDCCKKYSKTDRRKETNRNYQISEKGRKMARAGSKRFREYNPIAYRRSRLKYLYNITLEEYDSMLEQQNGVCFICGLTNITQRLCVDHNHETGKVRKLLCDRCNRIIGAVYESTELLEKLKQYVINHKEK